MSQRESRGSRGVAAELVAVIPAEAGIQCHCQTVDLAVAVIPAEAGIQCHCQTVDLAVAVIPA